MNKKNKARPLSKNLSLNANNELFMPQRFNWEEFDKIRKMIYVLVNKLGHDNFVLDFKRTEFIYPNGVVPLIALARTYQSSGVRITIVPPRSVALNKLVRFEGWFHAIDPERFDAPSASGFNSLPLRHYANDYELNAAVSDAIEVALRNLTMAKSVPDAFEWALNELAGNVLHHAKTGDGYLQVNTFKGIATLSLVVVDAGVGVPASMRERFTDMRSDRVAVEKAVQKGVTSKPNFGQGNGLAGCLAIALHSGGYFSLTSGGGRLTVEEGRLSVKDFIVPLKGTVVELQLPTDREIDLPAALWGHKPSAYIEERYEKDAKTMSVRMLDIAPTFGNRITGESVRTMIQNLLISNPSADLELDFSSVNIIASSFADEVFGKLFLILGALEFGSRIRYVGVNGTCKTIINTAIRERAGQGL